MEIKDLNLFPIIFWIFGPICNCCKLFNSIQFNMILRNSETDNSHVGAFQVEGVTVITFVPSNFWNSLALLSIEIPGEIFSSVPLGTAEFF